MENESKNSPLRFRQASAAECVCPSNIVLESSSSTYTFRAMNHGDDGLAPAPAIAVPTRPIHKDSYP
jgi:hypothetical protein